MNCIDEAVKIEESFGVNVRGQALAILKKIADLENTTSLENIEEAWSDYGNDIIQDEFRGCEGHMSRLQIARAPPSLKEAASELIDNHSTILRKYS